MSVSSEAKSPKKSRRVKNKLWGPFVRFYTRFKIPWWLFILSAVGSIAYAEFNIKVGSYLIALNKGELYNSVILTYAALTLAMSVLAIAFNMANAYGSGIVTLRARQFIWRKIIYLPANTFDTEQPSAFISRITSDIPEASSTIEYLCLFVSSAYGFVRTFTILYKFNAGITLWLLCVIPIAVLDFWAVGLTQYRAYKRMYGSLNKMMAFFSEHLSAMKHSKAQAMEEEEIKAGYAAIEKRFRADIFYSFMVAAQITIHSVYTRICFFILVFAGKKQIEDGKMDSKGIVTGNTYLNYVQQYLAEILTQYEALKRIQAVMGRVSDLAETPVEQKKSLIPLAEEQHDVILEHVSFGYSENNEILHDISVTIPAGKKTAIVGQNGCGKSTLFKLLMRFYKPTSGEIYYGADRAEDIHLDEWRKSFGYVLQNSPLLAGTIKDNITYGCEREVSEAELIAAAKAANAYDFICEFPEGFDKEVGEGGMYLSGGQRQRIAIARAVISNPRVLLMDEATASLDYVSNKLIWEAAEKLMEGRTTVLIAHDMNAVMTADNIIVMSGGRIEATGTHEYLMGASPTYREYVTLQKAVD